jgi:hypothetical protein
MSRLNPKQQTLMQRFGYHDADLTTPAHDHLIFWAKEHIEEILAGFYPPPSWEFTSVQALRAKASERIAARIDVLRKWQAEDEKSAATFAKSEYSSERDRATQYQQKLPLYDQEIARLEALSDLPEPPTPKIELRQPPRDECPVGMGDRNNSIVGFLDMVVRCHVPKALVISGGKQSEYDYQRNIKEWTDPTWAISYDEKLLGFEIKTSIPSYGELMRQVNTYRRYFGGELVVVSPDGRFADQVRSQGVRFVLFEGDLPKSGPQQGSLL